jgi:hypothetical protein
MGLDAELLEGARNTLRVCLNVQASDRVLVVTDDDTNTVGEALHHEALAADAIAECARPASSSLAWRDASSHSSRP